MFKKTGLTLSATLLLAACSSTQTPYQQTDFVNNSGGTYVASPDVLSSDPLVAGEITNAPAAVADLRKELIRSAGDRVHFGFDSAALTSEAQEQLRGIASFLKEKTHKINSITIEGHCDERGTREYNLALGERRAISVKRYLVGLGIDASKINTISYGKERPVDPRHTDRAWSRNRRSVVVVE